MKKFLAIIALTAITFSANAQAKKSTDGKFTFAAGPVVSLPLGTFGDGYSFGVGAEVEATYHASSSFQAFAQVGYTSFIGKTIDLGIFGSSKVPSTGFLPVLVGGRYVSNGFSIGAGIGYGSFSSSGNSSGGFAYSPQVGYNFGKINLIGSYNGISSEGSTSSFAGLKAFYTF